MKVTLFTNRGKEETLIFIISLMRNFIMLVMATILLASCAGTKGDGYPHFSTDAADFERFFHSVLNKESPQKAVIYNSGMNHEIEAKVFGGTQLQILAQWQGKHDFDRSYFIDLQKGYARHYARKFQVESIELDCEEAAEVYHITYDGERTAAYVVIGQPGAAAPYNCRKILSYYDPDYRPEEDEVYIKAMEMISNRPLASDLPPDAFLLPIKLRAGNGKVFETEIAVEMEIGENCSLNMIHYNFTTTLPAWLCKTDSDLDKLHFRAEDGKIRLLYDSQIIRQSNFSDL